MPRYTTRARRTKADWDDDWYEPPLITSIEVCDHIEVDTGLLDKDGNSIWRRPEPMGFIHYD